MQHGKPEHPLVIPEADDERTIRQLTGILGKAWSLEPGREDVAALVQDSGKAAADVDARDTSSAVRQVCAGSLHVWLRLAEEYVSVRVVEYIATVLDQLRRLALFLLGSMLLTTALLSSYPFHPQSRVKLIFFVILLGTVVSVLTVMMQMSRDEVLSLIAKTSPGHITWSPRLVLSLVIFGVIPLLYLISTEFPTVGHAVTVWMDPVINVVRRM